MIVGVTIVLNGEEKYRIFDILRGASLVQVMYLERETTVGLTVESPSTGTFSYVYVATLGSF